MDEVKKKKVKKIIVAVVVIAVILSGIFIISENKIAIGYRLLYSVFPDYMEITTKDDVPLTIYKRLNDDYDSKKDEEINFMEFYYYDENGKEVIIAANDSLIYNDINNGSPYFAFFIQSAEKLAKIKTAAIIVGSVVAVAVIVWLIIFWFMRWSKRQDAEKTKKYGNKKAHKKKK